MIVIKANCNGGCPCENYQCESETNTEYNTNVSTSSMQHGKAVFMLKTYDRLDTFYSRNKPMVIDLNGIFEIVLYFFF